MGRLQPVNDALDAALAGLAATGWNPQLLEAVNAALGVSPGVPRTAAAFPVVAFHLQAGEVGQALTLYLLTPARFIRYEVLGPQSLTVALPLSRVSQVVEKMDGAAGTMAISIELDAGARVLTAGYEEGPGGPATVGRQEGRVVPTTYDISASSATGEQLNSLWVFARALRSAIGM